jgi:hypothetical protein
MLKDLSRIQVSSLKDPYQEIAWLFTRVTGQDSTKTIPWLALYILYFVVHEDVIFDWKKIISNEISAQLMNFRREKKFYMESYLVFAITHCHFFKGLSIGKRVNSKIDPVTMCYQALSRHKAIHFFMNFTMILSLNLRNYFLGKILLGFHWKHQDFWIKRELWKKWTTTTSLGFSVLMKSLYTSLSICQTNCLSKRWKGNISLDFMISMRKGKNSSFPCLGKWVKLS